VTNALAGQTGLAARVVRVLYRNRAWLWLVPAVPAVILAGLIMVALPPDQKLDDVAEWLFRLSPFLLAVLAVSLVPRNRFSPALLVLAVLVYMGFLDTEMVLRILAYGDAPQADQGSAFRSIYQFELFTVTFVVLFALLALRLGGARTTTVLKVGVAAVLVVISGLNDFTFWATYSWPDGRPDRFEWASHMIIFLGGPPTPLAAAVFTVVHLALACAVLTLPLERWTDRMLVDEPR